MLGARIRRRSALQLFRCHACDLRATCAEDRKIEGGNLSPIRRNMLLFTRITFGRTIGTGAAMPSCPHLKKNLRSIQE